MDPQPPTGAATTPPRDARQRVHASTRAYILQVRAFLEATEVVDADPDTIEDILDGLDEEILIDKRIEFAQNANASSDDEAGQNGEQSEEDDDSEDEEYERYLEEAQTSWTKEEVKAMRLDLKENGMAYFVKEYVAQQNIPISKLLYAFGICLCKQLREKSPKTLMYFLEVAMHHEMQTRERLTQYNTVDDAVNLIKQSQRIIILTGAGISVSCGIPDFRSRNGIYALLQQKGEYDLDDPQQMFDIQYFRENPAVFYSFASSIYPSNFIPSPCHRFIKLVEDKGKLLRNYTQNIDTLETRAGVHKVLQCHGSFATASCVNCRTKVPGSVIEQEIMKQVVPLCKVCNDPTGQPVLSAEKLKKKPKKKKNLAPWESDSEDEPDIPAYPPGIMKPDITFFGEKLTDEFDRALIEDRPCVDLLLVIGTSLKVSPVSEILTQLRHSVPQILINKTPVRHINPDIVLLGNADEIIKYLCRKLEWELPGSSELPSTPSSTDSLNVSRPRLRKRLSSTREAEPRRAGNSHVWLFEGAEGGKWVEDLEKKYRGSQSRPASRPSSRSSSRPSTPSQLAIGGDANGEALRLMKKQRIQ